MSLLIKKRGTLPNFNLFLLKFQVVLSCVEGSPAARAGIHEGDELVEINGTFFLLNKHNKFNWQI